VGRAALARFGFPVVVAAHRGSMGKTSRPVKPPPPVPAVVWWPCGGAARRRLLKGRPTPPQGAALNQAAASTCSGWSLCR
jgi:hypothetical protein